ncbi:MAG: hypothetical protein JST58_06225 [Bacteroidetes bacterium]|nr:hypothetical protein [Bacteroidota bacterium]
MSFTNTASIGVEHTEWINKLEFYKNDIGILEQRLMDIAGRNSSSEAMAGIEHFQNQFIVQRNNIDELKHAINENVHLAFEDAISHAGRIDGDRIGTQKKLEVQVRAFEKVVNELRQEFNQYAVKWM